MIGEFFDPKAGFSVELCSKPHWSQAGAIVFVTFRTIDSIPKSVFKQWEQEKLEWIRGFALKSQSDSQLDLSMHWSELLRRLPSAEQHEFNRHFNRCREIQLDECLGACVLKRPELAKIVADALMHFDGDRYCLGDFIIMPNHVHLLVAFANPEIMRTQFASWLRFSARKINERLNQKGHFWQQEPFDHLVRSPEQYAYYRNYIAENPKKAGLNEGEYFYRRYEDKM